MGTLVDTERHGQPGALQPTPLACMARIVLGSAAACPSNTRRSRLIAIAVVQYIEG